MRVLQLLSSGTGFYGAERVSFTLSAELNRIGVATVVAAFRNNAKEVHLEVLERAAKAGLPTETVDCTGRFDLRALNAIKVIIDRHAIDVVHTHGIKSDLYGWLAARQRKVSLIGTCHSWTNDGLRSRAISVADRCLLQRFDAVAIVSESLAPRLCRMGVRADRIVRIENGIDCMPFVTASKRQAGDTRRDLVVGTVGRLVPVKGLVHLLDAAAILLRDFPRTRFVIVGGGPELTSLEHRASALGISQRVEFWGTRESMPEVYASFDVFALPSLSEAMPMALIEAMATGLPVVASSVGSVTEMVRNNETGILAEPANSTSLIEGLRELLGRADLRADLGRAAQRWAVEHFSAQSMCQSYLSTYETLGKPAPMLRTVGFAK